MKKFFLNINITKQIRFMLAVLLLCFSTQALASHFRFGLVTATRLSETSTTVTYRINVSTSWRLGVAPTSTPFTFSGGNTGSVSVPMTNVTDPSGGWTNSTGTTTITLNKSATLTRLTSTSCCKISTLINNRDRRWDIYIVLNTNAPGSSPVSTSAAIINMPVNAAAATAQISASDPDPGSTLTFGMPNLVTGNLAGQTEPPGWSVSSSGLMTFNTVGKTVGQLYNAMVTVTDNNGNQIFLDFIINIVGPSNPPVFDYSVTPANGQVFNLTVGQNLTFLVRATDSDPGSTVSFSVSGLNSFITTANFSSAPLPATGNPAQTTFSYTPVVAQSGSQTILNFIATDNVGVQATSSVTINVIAQPAPVFIAPTPAQGSIRSILTGVNQADNIVASSSLGSNVSIAFATLPPGATTSPAVPTAGANPGSTTMNWIPTPSQFGQHTLSYTATISSIPTIFSVRSYDLIVNTLPVFASTPVTGATDCSPYLYNIVATDANIPFGDVVNIVSVLPLPSWLTLTSTGNGTATLSGSPTTANVGTYTITLRAEDFYYHNYADVEQSFIITVASCCTPPVITCPSDITVSNMPGQCGATVSFTGSNAATATGSPAVVITYSPASGSLFPVGTTTVTATATNSCGTAPCTFTVTVTDNEAPSITCAAAQTQTADAGVCNAAVTVVGFATGDNCGVASVTNSYNNTANASGTYPVGTTTVTWTVTDIHGNTNTCTQNITVTDNEAPSITCAAAQTQTADEGVCNAAVTVVGPATGDNCGVASVTNSHNNTANASGTYPVGTTTVTWTVTDIHGNTNTCTQNITVTDNEAPVISVSPVLSCYAANNFGCSINLGATATDNCGVLSLTSDAPGCFPVGTTVVTWTATDIHGNVSTATQLVTRNPEINIDICAGITRTIYTGTVNGAGPFGPQNINLTSTVSGGTPGYSYSWSPAAGLNNPFIANPVASPAVTTTYTLTVTDSKGCTRSLSITINVLPLSSAICSGSGNNVQFSVCHIPPGNPSNPQNICISVNALNAHLTSGSNGHNNCYLGPCGQQLCFSTVPGAPNFVQAKGTIEETVEIPVTVEASKDEPTDAFKVHIYPNPSAGDFSLKVISKSSAPISVKITDLSGKVMTVNSTVVKGSIINLGNELRAGTYIAEVIQGASRQVIKLVKVN